MFVFIYGELSLTSTEVVGAYYLKSLKLLGFVGFYLVKPLRLIILY